MQSIRTSRLLLEPQMRCHAEEMFGLLSDPALYEFEGEAPESVEWLEARFARLESRRSPDQSEGWLNWVVREQDSGELVGYVQATVYGAGKADVAYVLASRHWGRGLATEAVVAMLQELEQRYGVREFSAVLKRENFRSSRLLERLGFGVLSAAQASARQLEPDEVAMVVGSNPSIERTSLSWLRQPKVAAHVER
jgi:RimJ/RimL family protein N-acetyltransferase